MPNPITLLDFDAATAGPFRAGELVADAAGDLFGLTHGGGPDGQGTVFEIANTVGGYASTPTTLASFESNGSVGTGAFPEGGLIADTEGDLFGTTLEGGANGGGTVFEIPFATGGYAATPITLASFDETNSQPVGVSGLLADAAGDLLGTTAYGGAHGQGSVFELLNNGGGSYTPTTLVNFDGTNGENPSGGVIADAAGNLFAATGIDSSDGNGAVYEIAKAAGGYASTPTLLVSFDGADASILSSGLIVDRAGNLFGTSEEGGIDSVGSAFEIAKTSGGYATTPTTLVSFDGTDGEFPTAGLLADAAGDLFGTTAAGGANGVGTVFELTDTGFVACYLRGTRIATPTGERAIETLAPGDLVLTAGGTAKPVRWPGRSTRSRRFADPLRALPIRIRAGALGETLPARDLLCRRVTPS